MCSRGVGGGCLQHVLAQVGSLKSDQENQVTQRVAGIPSIGLAAGCTLRYMSSLQADAAAVAAALWAGPEKREGQYAAVFTERFFLNTHLLQVLRGVAGR